MNPIGIGAMQATSNGALAAGVLLPHTSMDSVWQHIERALEALAAKGNPKHTTRPENGLSDEFLDEIMRSGPPYYFCRENMEDRDNGHSKRTDITARAQDGGRVVLNGIPCAGTEIFLVLEAKRLPAPKPKAREQEYLSLKDKNGSEQGGVGRFKLGDHAKGLKEVGMVGYVQKHDFAHWQKQINTWIDALVNASTPQLPWDAQDRLRPESLSPKVAQLRSDSMRVSDNQRIHIRHFWVKLA